MANVFNIGHTVSLKGSNNPSMVVLEKVKVNDQKHESTTGFKSTSAYKYRCGWFDTFKKDGLVLRDKEWFYEDLLVKVSQQKTLFSEYVSKDSPITGKLEVELGDIVFSRSCKTEFTIKGFRKVNGISQKKSPEDERECDEYIAVCVRYNKDTCRFSTYEVPHTMLGIKKGSKYHFPDYTCEPLKWYAISKKRKR